MKVVIAEKPSVARDISKCLNANQKREGYFEGNGWIITWAFGHMVELKNPDEYDPALKKWSIERLPFIPDAFQLKPRKDKRAREQLNIIKTLVKKADEIICATDAGREGELIFRYIQHWCNVTKTPFKRLWISSLTHEAIQHGFKNLKEGTEYDNLFYAAKCRSEADWIVGLNSTRFFTIQYGQNGTLWSVGRVQTPVLAMIVKRDQAIESFKPEDFWEIHTIYRAVTFKHSKGRFSKQNDAESIVNKIRRKDLEIVDIKEKRERINPPLLYDLTDLQKDMNRKYGLTAEQTLSIAQNLYEKKHITYPRTDSRYLTDDMKLQIPTLFQKLRSIKEQEISFLNLNNLKFTKRVIDNSKVSDHHAIIPTNVIPNALSSDESKVYDAIVTRFIALFYPHCLRSVTTVTAIAEKEPFRAIGTIIVDPGWKILYPNSDKKNEKDKKEDQIMPNFQQGEKGAHQPTVKTFKTSPPKHFTEATLLAMMETAGKIVEDEVLKEALKERGIGTPATRAAIIEVLLKRMYILRDKKNLLSTSTGKQLISLIQDPRLKSPELTGEWEAQLKQIEAGEYNPDSFMNNVINHTREILKQGKVQPIKNGSIGQCPKCSAAVIQGKKGYGCSDWKKGCDFVLWKNSYGMEIDLDLAMEIIQSARSIKSYPLNIDGETIFGHLIISEDGKLSYERSETVKTDNNKESIGVCPNCHGSVIESQKSYSCENWVNGCKFVIWKTIAKKTITLSMAKKIIKNGESGLLKGFKSKSGKEFSTNLKLINNEVTFDFS